MHNKTKFTAFLAVSAASIVAVATSLMGAAGIIPMAEVGPAVWYHYAKVDPTEETHGSREFWAKASEGCSAAYFEAPGAGATVLERDFSGNAYFAQLEHGDARYIPSLDEQERLGNWPLLSSDGKTVTYGLYPQKKVDDEDIVSALNSISAPESNGYYLYQYAYYAKTTANPCDSSDVFFDDGTKVVKGDTYWFKCEPIEWKVLSETDGTYYVLSDVLLDAYRYNKWYLGTKDGYYANNYLNSEIRAWLNGDFYASAFALADSDILTTDVDNSAATTDSIDNSFACADTQDKVFLPSYNDYLNPSYGFLASTGNSNDRSAKTTEWARARGAWHSTSFDCLYNDSYWTRSPNSISSIHAWYIGSAGNLNHSSVEFVSSGVRPALSIVIS